MIHRVRKFIKGKALYGAVAVIVVVGLGFLTFGGKKTEEKLLTVERGPFVQEVSVSGKVVAADDVDLSFAETGRVASINVEVGDHVAAGETLASLASATLASDLKAAEANLALKRAEARNTAVNLEEIKQEQDTLVASAYRDLLSEGLAVVPVFSTAAEPPTITGVYEGSEGAYRIRIKKKENSNDFELRVLNLESVGPTIILEDEPTPLGKRGLFITFTDDLSAYDSTTWEIAIPNQKSTVYRTNFNAYEEAKRTRDRAIAQAEAELRGQTGGSVAEAEVQRAEADVARIRAAIGERSIRAPFAGVITDVDAKLGGVASANEPAISLISAGTLQIESFVPEINISFIEVGDKAAITLDAYGESSLFDATVASIDPAETLRDGVSTYRALLQLDKKDERVRSGMTANVRITTDKREGIISIPQGIVEERDGKKYVQIRQGKETVEREVVTGAVSSLGNVEILNGLSEGDMVVLTE